MKKIMIMAGGTGGHVFPGIALAEALKVQGIAVVWLGTKGGMEEVWVKNAQIPFYSISINGLRRNGWIGWLKAPFKVISAWLEAKAIIKIEQPNLVLGMGGFVCGPGGLAAKVLGLPLVLHEQNAVPGLTNKLLARFASKVICAFPQRVIKGTNVVTLGNPVRAELESLAVVKNTYPCHLLVLGGSRGSLAINKILPQALALMDKEIRPAVTHQTGEKTFEEALHAYKNLAVTAEIIPFIDNMPKAYATADMVLCRAGALTVSELMVAARPAIMIPYPHAVDDHQTVNAQALVSIGGGEVIQETVLTPKLLFERLTFWCEAPSRRVAASESIRNQAGINATKNIVSVLNNTMAESTKDK